MTTESPPLSNADQRHQPKQTRSVETRNSLLDAAAALFAQQGYEKTTTHHIAAEARVSVGALYRYFSDKEGILHELYLREMSRLRDSILEKFSTLIELGDNDIRGMVRQALIMAFDIFAEDAVLRQVLSEQSRKTPALAQLRRNQEDELHTTVAAILKAVPQVSLPDVDAAAYLISLFLENLIEDFLLYRRQRETFSQERIIEAGTDFVIRYLRIPEKNN